MVQERALPESFGYHFCNGDFERIYRQPVQGSQLQMEVDAGSDEVTTVTPMDGGVVKVMEGEALYISKAMCTPSPAGPRQGDRPGRGCQ